MGYETKVEWLRFNHLFSKPLLAFCRLAGLTRYEMRGGIRVGYHDFHRSKLISWLFVWFQYLDAWRVLRWKIHPAMIGMKKVLILDRYVYDILVDLIIDTRIDGLSETWLGKRLISLLPKECVVILIVRDEQEIMQVRPECTVDDNFMKRMDLYRKLADQRHFNVIDNDADLNSLLAKAERCAGVPG
jgi:thymidylate kinase